MSSPKPLNRCLGRGKRLVWRLRERAQARQVTVKFLTPSVVSSLHAASVIMAVGLTFVQTCLWPGDLTSGIGDNLLISLPLCACQPVLSRDGLLHAHSLVPGFLLLCVLLGISYFSHRVNKYLTKNPLQGGKDYLTLWFEGIIHHGRERPGLGA